MRRRGVSLDFMNDVSKRIERLKQFGELEDDKVLNKMINNVQKIQASMSEVEKSGPSVLVQEVLDSSPINISSIKQTNSELRKDVKNTLKAFHRANLDYMNASAKSEDFRDSSSVDSEPVEEVITQINCLQAQINQTNSKVIESESLILTKEIENLRLKEAIFAIEQAKQSKQQQEATCNCGIF